MNVEKVMEILDQFQAQAVEDIELDKAIDTDDFESAGKYKLIGRIRKRIIKEAADIQLDNRTGASK